MKDGVIWMREREGGKRKGIRERGAVKEGGRGGGKVGGMLLGETGVSQKVSGFRC